MLVSNDVFADEKADLVSPKDKTELPECFFEEMNRLEQEVAYLRLALKKSRKHLHMAHVELGAKVEEIYELEAELCNLSGQLEGNRSGKEMLPAMTGPGTIQARPGLEIGETEMPVQDKLGEPDVVIASASRAPAVSYPVPLQLNSQIPDSSKGGYDAANPRIDPILFAKKATVNRSEQDRIEKECKAILEEHPAAKFFITGHADDFSLSHTNRVVSLNRASFLARDLEVRGIPRSALTVEGKGDSEPSATGNRRVEFKIILP